MLKELSRTTQFSYFELKMVVAYYPWFKKKHLEATIEFALVSGKQRTGRERVALAG